MVIHDDFTLRMAFLCDHAYRSDPQILPSSYAIDIEGAAQYGVGAHDRVSDSFLCTKCIKTGTFEDLKHRDILETNKNYF